MPIPWTFRRLGQPRTIDELLPPLNNSFKDLEAAFHQFAVRTLGNINDDLGEIVAGQIHNAADTAGILISGALPGTWTRYLDLTADAGDTLLKHDKLALKYDGTALFEGQIDINAPTQQTGAGDAAVLLRDPDVAHGITSVVPTDVYGAIGVRHSLFGGLFIEGLDDNGLTAVVVNGTVGASVVASHAIVLQGWKKSTTSRQQLGATEELLGVRNGGNDIFEILGDGTTGIRGALSVSSSATILSNLTVGGTLSVSAAVTLKSTLSVVGTAVFGATLDVLDSTGGLRVGTTFGRIFLATGATKPSWKISVQDVVDEGFEIARSTTNGADPRALTYANLLRLVGTGFTPATAGGLTFGSVLLPWGDIHGGGNLLLSANATVGGTLSVSAAATLKSTLSVGSTVVVGGTLSVVGSLRGAGLGSFGSDLSATGYSRGDTLRITDGVSAPAAVLGAAILYVDTADGDLKIKFGDGVTKTLATDT